MSLETATSLLADLKAKFAAGDLGGGKETLTKLKIAMLDFPPGSPSHTQIAVESMEIGILMMVEDGDLDAFARYVTQIKPMYASLASSSSSSSSTPTRILSCRTVFR
uniref:Uncharacterized protein n=1 Tax=Pseudo-nitzschia australis TaxID=44445 RepID=A0A7S4EKF0_9STRA